MMHRFSINMWLTIQLANAAGAACSSPIHRGSAQAICNEWLGMAIVLVTLTTLIACLALLQRIHPMKPETSRKLFHMTAGLTTLALPWLFSSPLPVIVLTLITVPALLALKYTRSLKNNLGAVLYRVERTSYGEVYFPISVCLVFILANGNPLTFSIPVLLLALADPAAAIIGGRYGQVHYSIIKGKKSLEGSAAFLAVALVCILVPLLLLTSINALTLFLIALTIALVVMFAEAIAWEGLDNLLIPLVSFGLLMTLPRLDVQVLFALFVVVGCLLGAGCVWAVSWKETQQGEHS